MGKYLVRRLLSAVPTLLVISFLIFAILDLAPGDPTSDLPLTIPPEVRAEIRASLGLDEPFPLRYLSWLRQFFIDEPLNLAEALFGISIGDSDGRTRIRSWTTRGPVVELIAERLPQTLWVVGLAYVLSVVIAVPLGVLSATKQYSPVDQVGTLVAMVGYSMPTFFTGLLAIVLFSVRLRWFPSVYNTTLEVTDWASFVAHARQLVLPVAVLTFYNAAQLSRFTRSAVLDNLPLEYVRTARSKGLSERVVIMVHVLRNSLIPVATLVALGIPQIFGGAIITEQIFRVNGLGQLLVSAVLSGDVPLVQTLTFIFAVLIVGFNIIVDLLYGLLDPRIRYE